MRHLTNQGGPPPASSADQDPRDSILSEPTEAPGSGASLLRRFAWLCPLLAIIVSAGLLAVYGLSWRNAFLAALILVCPAIILWGVITLRRP